MKIIVIGAVAGGTSAAAKARRNDDSAEIIIYEKDQDISYSGCGLPYFIGGKVPSIMELTPRTPEFFKSKYNIDIHIHHEVLKINIPDKNVVVKNLETGAVMNFQSEDGNTKKAVLSIAKKKFLIVETKKFECEGTFCFSSLNEFDAVITEKKQEQLSPNIKKLIKINPDELRILLFTSADTWHFATFRHYLCQSIFYVFPPLKPPYPLN